MSKQDFNLFLASKRRSIKIIATVVFLLFFVFLSYEYRLSATTGEVTIFIPESGAQIFLDDKQIDVSRRGGESITLKHIRPGKHSFIVYKEGSFPWGKTLSVRQGSTTEASAFLVPKHLAAVAISNEQDKERIASLFARTRQYVKQTPTKDIEIEYIDGSIVARWIAEDGTPLPPFYFCVDTACETSVPVFTAREGSVVSLDFYPERKDIILFAYQNNIYAIEIDKTGTQNFQPIYTGVAPRFLIEEHTSLLYIEDNGAFFELNL